MRVKVLLFFTFFVTSMLFNKAFEACAQEPKLRTVVLDPGHGGKDPGALGKSRTYDEKHLVLDIAKRTGDLIKKHYPDVKVVYTRSNDTFVSLNNRVKTVKDNNADLFISFHINSTKSSTPRGASVYILGPESNRSGNTKDYFEISQEVARRENSVIFLDEEDKAQYKPYDPSSPASVIFYTQQWTANFEQSLRMATEVDNELRKNGPFPVTKLTGIRQDVFQVLAYTGKPAVLLELGYISNPSDYNILISSSKRAQIAQCLFKAFSNYKAFYDGSVTSEPDEVETATVESSTYYGVQVMTLSRLLNENDPAFHGHPVNAVKDGNVYKYILYNESSREAANNRYNKVKGQFKGAFVVKVENGEIIKM